MDCNPELRRKAPHFYGFVHDDAFKRTVCFVCMMALSALLIIAKSLTTGLLMSVSVRVFFYEYLAEFAIFFLYKVSAASREVRDFNFSNSSCRMQVVRRDLVYPLKATSLTNTIFYSLFAPILAKVSCISKWRLIK